MAQAEGEAGFVPDLRLTLPELDHPSARLPNAESPQKLFLLALFWLGTAFLGGVVAFSIYLIVTDDHHPQALTDGGSATRLRSPVGVLVGLVTFYSFLLLAAWRRAKIVGQGDRIKGFGGGRLKRPVVLVGLAVAGMIIVLVWQGCLAILLKFPEQGFGPMVPHFLANAWTWDTATLAMIVVVVPICEELFFRGWLWTGLRQHWGVLPVMLGTALLFMAIHMPDGLTLPLFLLPSVIMLTLARHFCGGVRASILLHMLNNLTSVGLPSLVVWLRQG